VTHFPALTSIDAARRAAEAAMIRCKTAANAPLSRIAVMWARACRYNQSTSDWKQTEDWFSELWSRRGEFAYMRATDAERDNGALAKRRAVIS
jgi:hypothetical protein